MKILRHIGSLAFVLGLFCAVFAGIPWYVMVSDDPALPGWLKIAVFCLLGGILVVLMSVALEQRKIKASQMGGQTTDSERAISLSNSVALPGQKTTEILGLGIRRLPIHLRCFDFSLLQRHGHKHHQDTSQKTENRYPQPPGQGRIIGNHNIPGDPGKYRREESKHECQRANMSKYFHGFSFDVGALQKSKTPFRE